MRYLPHTEAEIKEMLRTVGAASVEDLFRSVPDGMRFKGRLALPEGLPEAELSSRLTELAMKNRTMSCSASFLGAGAYRHYVPAAVSELASRSEFVTPYTPYQPEISQGTLQAIFEYQSQICRLFGMDVSNASHYSGATAFADASLMVRRVGKGRKKIVVPTNLHPEYRETLRTVLCGSEDIVEIGSRDGFVDRAALKSALGPETAAVAASFPNFFGIVEDLSDVAAMAHEAGALFVAVVPEPVSLGILSPPGKWGADVAVGEGMSLGLPVSFGGPTLGIFTVREKLLRNMPGRVCGRTVDASGRPGYVLTLSTREQHIRREKATSNICSNQALCATTAAIHMSMLGKEGMRELSSINASKASLLKSKLASAGAALPFKGKVFNEFVIETKKPASELLASLAKEGIFGGVDLGRWYPAMKNRVLVCATEMTTDEEIERYAEALRRNI
ncbi:MAG TPA: aminomethyl-transferring glycine dehydrogenase subunit GcvPA [bacterium]|nr:aminomethyl-transferring glycine dehydrogenase subunit GcvPA [bacterium]